MKHSVRYRIRRKSLYLGPNVLHFDQISITIKPPTPKRRHPFPLQNFLNPLNPPSISSIRRFTNHAYPSEKSSSCYIPTKFLLQLSPKPPPQNILPPSPLPQPHKIHPPSPASPGSLTIHPPSSVVFMPFLSPLQPL